MTWPDFPFNFFIIPAIVIWIVWSSRRNLRVGLLPWYKNIKKPDWTPSGKLIGEIWTFIYVMTTLGVMWFWNVPAFNWFHAVVGVALLAMAYFHYQWHKTMFVAHDLKKAHSLLKRLFFAILLVVVLMAVPATIAAFIMLPYLIWIGLARRLSREILELNAPEKK